ncbi:gp53-like domain-containing protein, partial [Mycoavidus cysteinexigens]|uniref:gp53-like domain-containing protein n=1 Tax=Mycoavidus cysteinexigens TaxID=1553431 RepID=UPI0024E0C911
KTQKSLDRFPTFWGQFKNESTPLQWGQLSADTAGNIHILFPTPFLHECFGVHGIHMGGGAAIVIEVHGTRSKTGVVLRAFNLQGCNAEWLTQWIAIGR